MSRSISCVMAAAALALASCNDGPHTDPLIEKPFYGEPARLSFAWTPFVSAGEPFGVEVRVLDQEGVVANVPSVEVTVTASVGTLGGTVTRTSVGGIATFDDLVLTRAGATTLVASATGLEGAETPELTVAPGPQASLEFDAQPPATTTADATLPELRVAARDAWGNLVTGAWGHVTLSLPGAVLTGAATRPFEGGVATFAGLSVRVAGTGYRLSAYAGGPAPAVLSSAFDVWPGPADRLAFSVQPEGAAAGDVLAPVEVRVEDAFGNVAPAALDVTLATTSLVGTTTATAVAGTATFADLSVTLAGTATLRAIATGVSPATSAPFQVSPGATASLEFTAQPPAGVTAGAAMSLVRVEGFDAYGNRVTSSFPVTVSLDGAELLGTKTRQHYGSGGAEFTGLSVEKAGTGYRLHASTGEITAESAAFVVSPAAAHHLGFTAQPATSVAGATLPPVAVSALDTYGNVTTAYGTITLGFSAVSSAFPTLYGTKTRSLVDGTAVFDDLSVRTAGTGYRFAANGAYLGGAASETFDVLVGEATRLAFLVQPPDVRAGQAMAPAVEVAITDEWLNLAVTAEREVSLWLEGGAEGAALAGTTAVATVDRVASFEGLSVDQPGSLYRLRASAPGLPHSLSDPFDVAPNWLSIGPDGGDVTALAADPAASGVAYAATNGCVWKTVDGGWHWTRAGEGLPLAQIDALAVHPVMPTTLFAGGAGGLYRSTDAGASWSAVWGPSGPGRTLSLAITASGAIYAGTFQNGLLRSDDGGTSWVGLAAGLPAPRVTALALEPASTEVLYAAGVDPDGVGTVYRSLDRGDTWQETPLGPAALPGVQPTALLVDPSAADSIYVGTRTGVLESADRGASFVETLAGAEVRALAAHGASRVRFAAGTSGVWRKSGAAAWAATTGLPSAPKAIALATSTDGTALAGTRYGVYAHPASASGWTVRTTGLRAYAVTAVGAGRSGATVVYAATLGGGVHRSLNGGGSWQRGVHPAEGQMFYGIAVERGSGLRAWLAGASGLYRTTDGGATWTEVLASQGTIFSTLLDPAGDAVVYAGGTSDVFRSTAGTTSSFRDLNVCGGPARALALSASAPLALWVGGDAGLCRVDLAGLNQIFVPYASMPGTSGLVDAIAVDPDPVLVGSTVWASTGHGFFSTVDGGATWTAANDRFTALLAQPGKLFGTRASGPVVLSRDGGATFAPVGVGLFHGSGRALAAVPGVPDEIYVGTSWGSVFKTASGGE